MSYCRFSTDDHKSDVYVYESDQGFVTHVAASRYVFAEPLPEPIPVGDTPEEFRVWWKRQEQVSEIIERSKSVPIGGPYDGKTFVDKDAPSCAATLTMLAEAGYHVPDGVIDALLETINSSGK